jgi:hypothetical protein
MFVALRRGARTPMGDVRVNFRIDSRMVIPDWSRWSDSSAGFGERDFRRRSIADVSVIVARLTSG